MKKPTYVISQIYLPFFRQIIRKEKNKFFLILTTNYFDSLIANILKYQLGGNLNIVKLKTINKVVKDLELEDLRKQVVKKSNVKELINSRKSFFIALQWNGAEYIETEIRRVCNKSIILENGYFRPNSISIDSEFIRNAPKGLRENYKSNHLLEDIDKKNIFLAYKNFSKLNILDILYRIVRIKIGIRPRKRYFRSASLAIMFNKLKLAKKRCLKSENLKNAFIYYGQVADDSALILDPNYPKLKDRIEILINWAKEKDLEFYYRPHPKEFFDPLKSWLATKNIKIDKSDKFSDLLEAKYHATFASTVGFELLQKNIPVIVIGEPFYINAPGAFNLDQLNSGVDIKITSKRENSKYIKQCKNNHIIF